MGDPDVTLNLFVELQDIGGNAGTLASWPLQVRGMPFVIAELEAGLSNGSDGPFVVIFGWSAAGGSLLLGTDV